MHDFCPLFSYFITCKVHNEDAIMQVKVTVIQMVSTADWHNRWFQYNGIIFSS